MLTTFSCRAGSNFLVRAPADRRSEANRILRWPILALVLLAGIACNGVTAPRVRRFPFSVTAIEVFSGGDLTNVSSDSGRVRLRTRIMTGTRCQDFAGYAEGEGSTLTLTVTVTDKLVICQQYLAAFEVDATASGIPAGTYRVRLLRRFVIPGIAETIDTIPSVVVTVP